MSAVGELTLQEQRELYDQAQRWLDNKQVKKYYRIKSRLESYPLTPYLDYRSILQNIGNKPPIVVRNFIDSHADYPFSNRVAAPYLRALAQQKKWAVLLQFQKSEPRQEEFRCYYYTALLNTGNKKDAFQGASSLWLKGKSVSDACDVLFRAWEKSDGITDSQILARMFLAFGQRQLSLMKYLKRKVRSKENQKIAQVLLTTYRDPVNVDQLLSHAPLNDQMLKLVTLGLKKLASEKPLQAFQLVRQGKLQYLDSQQRDVFLSYLARRLMDEEKFNVSDSVKVWRDGVIATGKDEKLLEQRVRAEIRSGDWQGIYAWVQKLPESLLSTPRWQFWLGLSELKSGQNQSGQNILSHISGERSFYGVAATTYLNQPVLYPEVKLDYKPEMLHQYQTALIRIQELIDRNKIQASKSEWQWLLSRSTTEEQMMLAQYATQSRWYHLAVMATIKAQLWENLELRFPKAYFELFKFFGDKYDVDPVTLISVARQESAMDSRAYSPVGAKGVMQLMPSTARYMSRKYQLKYNHSRELFDVRKNIEFGTRYLRELLQRYNGNRILAFAAYNAGPSRVDLWLTRSSGNLDVYRFIESIPFRETRGYVQNILMFETYYRHLLGVKGDFLYPSEQALKY